MFRSRPELKKYVTIYIISLLLIGGLSACSIPISLGNLLPELGSDKAGTFTIPDITKSGFDLAPFLEDSKNQDLVGSTIGKTVIKLDGVDLDGLNSVIDLTGQDELRSKFVSISMSYKFLLKKVGNYTASNVALQTYMAPADDSIVSDSSNAFGTPIQVEFVNGSQIVEATVNLTPKQIQIINDKKLRIGFSLTGMITDFKSPTAGLSYEIQSLKIVDLKVNLDEQFPTGNNGDIISIANIDTGIAKVHNLTLDYAATIKQSTPTVLKGIATVELYLSAVSEVNLYSEKNLVKSIDVDLAKSLVNIEGQLKVGNPLVATVLADDKVRYGLKIKGTAIGIEAVEGNDSAVTFEYAVTKLMGSAGVGLF